MKKALKILKILQEENYYFQRFSMCKSDETIDNKRIKESIKELKYYQNRKCKNCKILGSCEKIETENINTFYCQKYEI